MKCFHLSLKFSRYEFNTSHIPCSPSKCRFPWIELFCYLLRRHKMFPKQPQVQEFFVALYNIFFIFQASMPSETSAVSHAHCTTPVSDTSSSGINSNYHTFYFLQINTAYHQRKLCQNIPNIRNSFRHSFKFNRYQLKTSYIICFSNEHSHP